MRIQFNQIMGDVVDGLIEESRKQRELADNTLKKAGKEYLFAELDKWTTTETEKHMPKLAKFLAEGGEPEMVEKLFKRFLNSKYKTLDEFKTVADFKKAVYSTNTISKHELADRNDVTPVYKDDRFTVYKGDNVYKCQVHTDNPNYTFCVGSKNMDSNLFRSYRNSDRFIYYFIRDNQKTDTRLGSGKFEDQEHYIVLGVREGTGGEGNYNVTLADNPMSGRGKTTIYRTKEDVLREYPQLDSVINSEKVTPKPLTTEEKEEAQAIRNISLRAGNRYGDDPDAGLNLYMDSPYELRQAYVSTGHTLTDSMWDESDKDLRALYMNVRDKDLSPHQKGTLSNAQKKTYAHRLGVRSAIKLANPRAGGLTEDEHNHIRAGIQAKIPNIDITNLPTRMFPYIHKGLDAGHSEEMIKIYLNPEFSEIHTEELMNAITNYDLTLDQLKLIGGREIGRIQIAGLAKAMSEGATADQIEILKNSYFNSETLNTVWRMMQDGTDSNLFKYLGRDQFTSAKMLELIQAGMPEDMLKIIHDGDFDSDLVGAIAKAYKNTPVNNERFKKYMLNPEYNLITLLTVGMGLKRGASDNMLDRLLANTNNTAKMRLIFDALIDQHPLEKVRYTFNPNMDTELATNMINSIRYGISEESLKLIMDNFTTNDNAIKILNVAGVVPEDKDEAVKLMTMIEDRDIFESTYDAFIGDTDYPVDAIEKMVAIMHKDKDYVKNSELILEGLMSGFPVKELLKRCKVQYSTRQRWQIRAGLKQQSVSNAEVALYFDPRFSAEMMGEIRSTAEGDELTYEQLKIIADPTLNDMQFKTLKETIITYPSISSEIIKKIANMPDAGPSEYSTIAGLFMNGLSTTLIESILNMPHAHRKVIYNALEKEYGSENIKQIMKLKERNSIELIGAALDSDRNEDVDWVMSLPKAKFQGDLPALGYIKQSIADPSVPNELINAMLKLTTATAMRNLKTAYEENPDMSSVADRATTVDLANYPKQLISLLKSATKRSDYSYDITAQESALDKNGFSLEVYERAEGDVIVNIDARYHKAEDYGEGNTTPAYVQVDISDGDSGTKTFKMASGEDMPNTMRDVADTMNDIIAEYMEDDEGY